ncbi:MAG: type II secretion system protein [Gammaproteobacteria bacterium]
MNKMKHGGIFNRRGFNLIEIAIVVVVLGLLGSAVLVPLSAILLREQYDREEVAMERARQAVIGYAARSATPGAVIDLAGTGTARDRFEVPAGRAYLPCPDITGDGYEDRNHYDNLGLQIIVNATAPAIAVAADGVVNLEQFNDIVNINNGRDLRTVGSCSAMRGFLPWKTLGLPATDVWGNLYTYAVDGGYSHSIVGFNQNSIADNYATYELIDPATGLFQTRNEIRGNIGGNLTQNFNWPIALCLGVVGGVDTVCDNTQFAGLTFAYGRVPGAVIANVARRNYAANDIVNGLIFVIVSHGRNGLGAGQYAIPPAVACNRSITDNANHENANYPFVDTPSAGILNPNCVSQTTPPPNRSAQFFTILRRNDFGDLTFDDVMVWATREQINEAITRNSPDLPLYIAP